MEEEEEEEAVQQEEEEDAQVARNSEEEEAEEQRAAAAELKNGLKNITFAEEVEVADSDFVSVFKDISFANASRGISY